MLAGTGTMCNSTFTFKTKALNLANLKEKINIGKICELLFFTVDQWRTDKLRYLELIEKTFGNRAVIVRSSASTEDSSESSGAGIYESVLNVAANEYDYLEDAVQRVIDSYEKLDTGVGIGSYQMLIQPMIINVVKSGVIFTRDIETGGPYYIINFEETDQTDTITSGRSNNHKIIWVYKNTDREYMEDWLFKIIDAVREVELCTGSDSIDIEFAVNVHQEIYILQVRPLVFTKIFLPRMMDKKVYDEINNIEIFLLDKQRNNGNIFGDKTVFGVMPDWNPAEIIGEHPKPLATSLYRYIIMKSAWRDSRKLLGYNEMSSQQLMVVFAGKPYVDVRNSFNSLLPQGLSDSLSHKLVNYYIGKLEKNPEFHDKVEFEIVLSCLGFDFSGKWQELLSNGFTKQEIEQLKKCLLTLTNDIVLDSNNTMSMLNASVEKLKTKRSDALNKCNSINGTPMLIEQLLEDCILYGTVPFSSFARCAFIGSYLLKSLEKIGILQVEQIGDFLKTIKTVVTEMTCDFEVFKVGMLDKDKFLEKYGHLRPGTYDITSFCYDERPDLYLEGELEKNQVIKTTNGAEQCEDESGFLFTTKQYDALGKAIGEQGFTFTVDRLLSFISESIAKREYIKFEFTKNLSMALKLIEKYGGYHGITREDMAYLDVNDILRYANENFSVMSNACLRQAVEVNKKYYQLSMMMHLPDLIFAKEDLKVVYLNRLCPNFITQKKIRASIVDLDSKKNCTDKVDLNGKIVLIESADPGYDWLFTRKIAGLVTKYGGVASHMSIRCSEFSIPAAIGCGEAIYNSVKNAKKITLNCAEKRIDIYEVGSK